MTDASWLHALAEIAAGVNDDPDALERLGDFHEEAEAFLYGRCHLMAIALHEATGLPIGAVYGGYERRTWLVHAFVMDGDDIVDIKGRRSVEAMLADFPDEDDPSDPTPASAEDILRLGEGRRRVTRRSLPHLAQARTAAPLVATIVAESRPSATPTP